MTIPNQSEPLTLNTHNGFEVYPMPMFVSMETTDVNALARWYQAALGFEVMFKAPEVNGQPMVVHMRRKKYQDVLIRPMQSDNGVNESNALSICFQAGEEIDRIADRAAAVSTFGKVIIGTPTDTQWNTRQVRIVDPDGRVLVFSHPRFDPELTEHMQRVFEADKGKA